MSKVNELRSQRAKAWDQAKAFLDSHRNEKGILSAEDTAAYEKMEQEIVDLGHEIERQERMDALERELAAPVNTPITAKPESRKVDEKIGRASDSYKKAFWSQARAKDGVSYEIRNALSEGVDSEGGYLVPDEFEKTLISALGEANAVREHAHVFSTSNGTHKIPVVVSKGTAAWIDENGAYTGAIDNCNGAAQSMADTMNNNLEGQLTILKSQLQELAISFGEILLPAVKKIVGWVQGFIDVLNSLPDGVKETIVTVALIAAALGPVLIIIGKIITAVGTIMTIVPKVVGVIKAVKTAFLALNATMLANPIVLIIAAIAALVAAFIYLWNNCDEFRQFWIDLWESVKEIAVAVWEALKEFFVAAWEFIKTTAETVWNALAGFFTGLWEGIKNTFTTVVNAISNFLSTMWNTIKSVAETIWNAISTFFTAIWNGIKTVVTTVVTAISTFLTTAWNTIKTVITTVLNAIKAVFSTVWNAIKNVVTTVVNGIKNTITTVWNGIKNTVTTVVNAIKTAVTTAFSAMWNGIKNTISGIYNTIKNGFANAVNFIKNLASSAFSWGADIINGIVNGIKSCIGKVKDAVCSVADTIKSFLHFSVPDEGPLTEYESWMPDFMSGLAKGIEKSKGMVKDAVSGLAADMVVNPQLNAGQMAMAGGGSVTSADMSSFVSAIKDAVSSVGGGSGDIVIPVYLGGTMLDEVIVNAQQRANLRSGGR